MEEITLLQGDCLKFISRIPAEGVDPLLVDPPYGIPSGRPP